MMKEYFFQDKTYYRINEWKSSRPTLVFVHGLSGSSSAWLPYEKIFENKYNILTYDMRGHGYSKKYLSYNDYEIKNFASDLKDLISYLNVSGFVLISHSYGTVVALEYTKLFGKDVSANILLSTIVGKNESFWEKVFDLFLLLAKPFTFLPFKPKPGKHIDYSKYPNSSDLDIGRCYADISNTTLRIYLYCLKQSSFLQKKYAEEKMGGPALLLHGVKDSLAPISNSIELSKKIKISELVLLPEANHIVVLNNIDEVSRAIDSFIEKNRGLI